MNSAVASTERSYKLKCLDMVLHTLKCLQRPSHFNLNHIRMNLKLIRETNCAQFVLKFNWKNFQFSICTQLTGN